MQIIGANFAQNGLFTSRAVFIGNDECKIINYYTTDTSIVCVTPPCLTAKCLQSENWSGSETETLSVYVQTVEGILGSQSTFNYHGSLTPYLTKVPRVTWATGTFSVVGKTSTDYLDDITIKLGDYFADLGDSGTLNPSGFYRYGTSTEVFFNPPRDAPSGFSNLTFIVQDTQSRGMGSGYARLFPRRRPIDSDVNTVYNYASSLSGVSYTTVHLPVISDVVPKTGSIGGGTSITIRGYGFSHTASDLTVIASGVPCDISYSDMHTIVCVTRPLPTSDASLITKLLTNKNDFAVNTTRPYGSAGVWVKIWNCASCSNLWKDAYAVSSFPWRSKGFRFSAWYDIAGSNGYSYLKATGINFGVETSSIFVAPYTGLYTFYMNSDDSGYLYGRRMDAVEAEQQLAYSSSWQALNEYFWYSSQVSKPIRLNRGQRYLLRCRTVSVGRLRSNSKFRF